MLHSMVCAVHLADWPGLGNVPGKGWWDMEQGLEGKGHTFESCRVHHEKAAEDVKLSTWWGVATKWLPMTATQAKNRQAIPLT